MCEICFYVHVLRALGTPLSHIVTSTEENGSSNHFLRSLVIHYHDFVLCETGETLSIQIDSDPQHDQDRRQEHDQETGT